MIEHFTHGYTTLLVAFAVSMTGSALGLLLAKHARRHDRPGQRVRWLILAAFAIGGTGIWVMHFVAMLGFTVRDAVLRYDPGTTALSALIAVAVVACGLFVIGLGRYTRVKLAIAGLLTGLGVAAMHYTGMAALSADVEFEYGLGYVIASVVIAIAAATTALWLSWRLERASSMWLAAAVMAVAVNLMHYTAMLGVSAGGAAADDPHGAAAGDLVFPMATLTAVVLLILVFTVVMVPTDEEIKADEHLASLQRRTVDRAEGRTAERERAGNRAGGREVLRDGLRDSPRSSPRDSGITIDRPGDVRRRPASRPAPTGRAGGEGTAAGPRGTRG
ncbi:MHYT domain-containing protein, NO-binding membrane sensor [Glycomyces sambucus]|uniref:MHYT domain-containing protein, NO-binding membrane sensor n=1 Tax=Glycomyces sambucus TaxID=380244 RepID=A0A1G9FWQ6_9ACTN|nr:MHYT domain-containing protein [Glycomyces sambucus]SDK92797.1 MHYT domain-containing protein, NO-binding membrane sensor [Glycomyces sambucus]